MEQFIVSAIEAFTQANGDVDKFELQLRRSLMNQQSLIPTPVEPVITPNFDLTPEMAEELAAVNLDDMSDEEVLQYAKRMGLIN